MSTYHLRYWSKGHMRRIYVAADDRSSLGYFEERVRDHRLAKGDDAEEFGRNYSTTLTDDVVEAILSSPSIAAALAEQQAEDDFARFEVLKQHAYNWIGERAARRNAPKRRRTDFEIDLSR